MQLLSQPSERSGIKFVFLFFFFLPCLYYCKPLADGSHYKESHKILIILSKGDNCSLYSSKNVWSKSYRCSRSHVYAGILYLIVQATVYSNRGFSH